MPVGVLGVGRLARSAHRDQCEPARDHVDQRVDGVADDAEAACQQAHDELGDEDDDADRHRDGRNQHRAAAEGFHGAS